jgi:alginate O-acetyltransferase complex protein AlgI
MFGINHLPMWDVGTVYFAYTNAILLVLLVIACLPRKPATSRMQAGLAPVWYGLLFFLSVAYLVDSTFNPFLYFRF